jgi:uncharacterized membrane protein HdeD (DUF308 family)
MLASQIEAERGVAPRWGWVVFRGVIAILFGLLAFTQPAAIGLSLVLLFGAFAFVGGVATLFSAARNARQGVTSWASALLEGLLGIAVGIVSVFWPATAALAFVWVIGIWAIAGGALEIAGAIRLRKLIQHEWMLALAGALSIVFGALVLYRPMAGGVAIVWWLGAYAVAFGVLMIALGLRLRSHARTEHRGGDLRHVPEEGLHQPA